jgi:hypothetical protein
MKKIIIRINLHQLKNETHVQFNDSIDPLFVRFNPQVPSITPLYGLYRTALDHEVAALDFIRASELTEQITEKDHVRDGIYRGLHSMLKGFTRHFEQDFKEAAHRLLDIFDHYGDIAQRSLDDETAAINDLLREFEMPVAAADIQLLGLGSWVCKLKNENLEFVALMQDRYSEVAGRTPYRMITTRTATDKYYLAIVNHLEAIVLTGSDEANELITEMNVIIERYKGILARNGKKKS